MRLGFLLALLLIITAVSVEAGLGKKLKKGLKKIGKPFEKGAKKGAEIAAAGVAGKAVVSAAGAIGRRKRYDHEEYVDVYSEPLFVEDLGRSSHTASPIQFKSTIDS